MNDTANVVSNVVSADVEDFEYRIIEVEMKDSEGEDTTGYQVAEVYYDESGDIGGWSLVEGLKNEDLGELHQAVLDIDSAFDSEIVKLEELHVDND